MWWILGCPGLCTCHPQIMRHQCHVFPVGTPCQWLYGLLEAINISIRQALAADQDEVSVLHSPINLAYFWVCPPKNHLNYWVQCMVQPCI